MTNSDRKYSVLITDVDNTLFDWFSVWYASFKAMIDEVVRISGLDEELLYSEIRQIHQRHGTSEYAFLIEEIPSLKKMYPDQNLLEIFDSAIDAFRKARRRNLRLYDDVLETLAQLKRKGVLIVAYTESQAYYTMYRFRKLNLDGRVDYLFSPPDHEIPDSQSLLSVRALPAGHYGFQYTKHYETPKGELKPNPKLLLDIVKRVGAIKEEVLYVGDSKVKDIGMAQDAGITDVFVKYGASNHRDEYNLLVKVTHWTDADVAREKSIAGRSVVASHALDHSFGELLSKFNFKKFEEKQNGK